MLFKRFLAIATLSTLLLTSLVACSKKGNDASENTPAPTVSVSRNETENTTPTPEVIPIGGSFTRENAYLFFGIIEGSWKVSGYLFPEGTDTEPLTISGATQFEGTATLSYTDDNNQLTFIFDTDSVTVKVDKGTDYAEFAGDFSRVEIQNSTPVAPSPEQGSVTELMGRIALTHYMLNIENLFTTIDTTALIYDSDYMEDFLLAYVDLFLVDKAELLPEVSDKYLCYTFTEEALNDLFGTVSGGIFTAGQLTITDSGIVSKDGNYYIPCQGKLSGGLTVSSNSTEEHLSLGGIVVKSNGTRYDLIMTLITEENSAAGSAGVQLSKVTYASAD